MLRQNEYSAFPNADDRRFNNMRCQCLLKSFSDQGCTGGSRFGDHDIVDLSDDVCQSVSCNNSS